MLTRLLFLCLPNNFPFLISDIWHLTSDFYYPSHLHYNYSNRLFSQKQSKKSNLFLAFKALLPIIVFMKIDVKNMLRLFFVICVILLAANIIFALTWFFFNIILKRFLPGLPWTESMGFFFGSILAFIFIYYVSSKSFRLMNKTKEK